MRSATVTPWQARLALIAFLVVGMGITANLLLLQERRAATAPVKAQPPRAAREHARTDVSPAPEVTKPQPAAAAARARPAGAGPGKAISPRPGARAKSTRTARQPPATTASTR